MPETYTKALFKGHARRHSSTTSTTHAVALLRPISCKSQRVLVLRVVARPQDAHAEDVAVPCHALLEVAHSQHDLRCVWGVFVCLCL